MDEDRDLERRLEAMFASAHPRRDFEDELWSRLQARRPWHARLGGWLRQPSRLAPALAGLAVVAVGAAGIGWLSANFHPGGSTAASTSGAAFGPNSTGLGILPAGPSSGKQATGSATVQPGGPAAPGVSGAALTFSGSLPAIPAELPVYRYEDPSVATLQATESNLIAQTGLPVTVSPSSPTAGLAPRFSAGGLAIRVDQPGRSAADAFLRAHGLEPAFVDQVSLTTSRVLYVNQFNGPLGPVEEVGPDGRPAGLEVIFSGSTIVSVDGPLDLALATNGYPLRSAADSLGAAGVGRLPSAGVAPGLDHARVVYLLLIRGGYGYYEPELLLTGPAGTVFAPLIAANWLAP
jgi:hypothetical protein